MRIVAIIANIMTEREFGWLVVGLFLGIMIAIVANHDKFKDEN